MSYAPTRAPGQRTPGFELGATVEITRAARSHARALADALTALGLSVSLVETPSPAPRALILTEGLGADDEPGSLHWTALRQVQASADGLGSGRTSLVILQSGGGDRPGGLKGAWRGGLTALAKTAQKEFPDATCRAIALTGQARQAAEAGPLVARELMEGGETLEVLIGTRGRRRTARLVPLDGEPDAGERPHDSTPGQDDVFLVTGGARGVTADCVVALAARTGAGFALLGRSALVAWPEALAPDLDEADLRRELAGQARAEGRKPKPSELRETARALLAGRDIRRTMARVTEAGGRAVYLSADLADPDGLDPALATAERELGPVTGLIHGAGVLADKRLVDKTEAQLRRVFAPKVTGLKALLERLSPDRLRHVALFSSAAARFGNPGQADYAMANEILNRLAWALAADQPALSVTCIDWGPWDGGMVDDGLRAHFERQGVPLIPRDAGAVLFADLVMRGRQSGNGAVELCVGGL